ncbi:glycoside hydrolase family 1 [Desulfurella acetivorans A63]|nr:glycoside hydrolase family 1 [Desulfurella acetivorans A63]
MTKGVCGIYILENPKTFFWGVATSAFQLEGSPYADWHLFDSFFEEKPEAVNHYSMYEQDLYLIKKLGVNAYRFSIEWSRIQPSQDIFNVASIAHYQEIIDELLSNNIEPFVTIHHFTHPVWFIKNYPWHNDNSVDKFCFYVEKLVKTIKNVKYWITFNEPYILLLGGYLDGCMPPNIKNKELAQKALKNILLSHAKVYDIIHTYIDQPYVGIAHNMAVFKPYRKNKFDMLLTKVAKHFYNFSIINAFLSGHLSINLPFSKSFEIDLPVKDKLDFFGINYYTRIFLKFNPFNFKNKFVDIIYQNKEGIGITDMGWEIYPKGILKVLKYASKLKVPLIITENGIATNNDFQKIQFIRAHLEKIKEAIADGINIKGYFYWSLIDNYEWFVGLNAKFGLFRVDEKTLKRKPTLSASFYAYIVKNWRMFDG